MAGANTVRKSSKLSHIDALMQAYYDRVAELYEEHQFLTHEDRRFVQSFVSECRENKINQLYDFGCGTCKTTLLFVNEGFTVEATDISERMIAIARQKYAHPKLTIHNASFERLLDRLPVTEQSEKVAAVFFYSLIHLPHERCEQILASLAKKLVPGSLLLVALHFGAQEFIHSPLNGDTIPVFGWKKKDFSDFWRKLGL